MAATTFKVETRGKGVAQMVCELQYNQQVSPTELESIIMQMPGVADCAVVGIPDILSGEIPRAFVVLRPGHHLTESEVCSFLEPKVAPYKKLAGGVRFLDVIPRNPAGKVLRDELKVFGANIEEVASS
ncbi:hypothetical protein J6590_003123 [Homalodisca vitripennis]|nr:hypothetical protein J6590_003123 [Homalodisca vitripennis]